MAFYAKILKGPFEHKGTGSDADENELLSVPPAKIDEMLLDALDALEQTRKLHESTANPETKRQTKRILDSLQSALMQLAPLGVHSVRRLARAVV
jgi:hypothetical protein